MAAALVLTAGLAWLLTAHHAHMMRMAPGMRAPAWNVSDLAMLLAMWLVMMVAMMTPAVSPMVTAFATINRQRKAEGAPSVATAVFLAGYLLAWATFSVLATALQLALHGLGLLDPAMRQTSGTVAAALFFAAGLYQLSPLKDLCLTRCRSTATFILTEWRDGAAGALVMGWRHGLFCIGCCALLMLLLFAVAVMDLRWVAALTALVMAEKLLPMPGLWRRLIGAGMIGAGAVLAARAML